MMKRIVFSVIILAALAADAQSFVCGQARIDFITLTPASLYTTSTPGFDLNTHPEVISDACTSSKPFFFSIAMPEGSYRITVTLGSDRASITTVWAEARRLMLEKIPIQANSSVTRTFDVNLRTSIIGGDLSHRVKLKPREVGNLDWDNKLTLEFNGDHPSLRSISIEHIKEPTIYLAGDSTVVDQDVEPWAAWGQMLPRFFLPGIVIANHAESGETVKSFVSEERLAKILSLIGPGDYLFMQFGHNDQKPNAVSLDQYKRLLINYIAQVLSKGATPVLVTSMNRRSFDAKGKITNSLAGYPDAMREIAVSQQVALIDLNAMSKTLFEAMGPDVSLKAFMHYPANAFPNQPEAIDDDTHFNSYGAYELARCVVHGIHTVKLPLSSLLSPEIDDFDPAKPDSQTTFTLPATPIPTKTDDVMKIPQM